MGMNQLTENLLQQWSRKSPADPILKWTQAMANNNKSAAQQIEKEVGTSSEGTPWDPRYSDSEFELIKRIAQHIKK